MDLHSKYVSLQKKEKVQATLLEVRVLLTTHDRITTTTTHAHNNHDSRKENRHALHNSVVQRSLGANAKAKGWKDIYKHSLCKRPHASAEPDITKLESSIWRCAR